MSYLHIYFYVTLGISLKSRCVELDKQGLILSSASYLQYASYLVIGGKVDMKRTLNLEQHHWKLPAYSFW